MAMTYTHSFPTHPPPAKNNRATAEWAVSIIRHGEEGTQSQNDTCFSSVSCLKAEALFSGTDGLGTGS